MIFTSPLCMIGVLYQAYCGFKAHKAGQADAQEKFLISCVLLATLQLSEGLMDWFSWVPGYSIAKLVTILAICFSSTSQQIIFHQNVSKWILSTESLIVNNLTFVRSYYYNKLSQLSVYTLNKCIVNNHTLTFVDDAVLKDLEDIASTLNGMVKTESIARLKASLDVVVNNNPRVFKSVPMVTTPLHTNTHTPNTPPSPVASPVQQQQQPQQQQDQYEQDVDVLLIQPSTSLSISASISEDDHADTDVLSPVNETFNASALQSRVTLRRGSRRVVVNNDENDDVASPKVDKPLDKAEYTPFPESMLPRALGARKKNTRVSIM